MYFNYKGKIYDFVYKGQKYTSGTKLVYDGKCYLDDETTTLDNIIVTWLYEENGNEFFEYNNKIYRCEMWCFDYRIVKILQNHVIINNSKKEDKEMIWTDDMVTNTLWYIVIMLVATIFYDRIGIWIIATVIWYFSTFKKK